MTNLLLLSLVLGFTKLSAQPHGAYIAVQWLESTNINYDASGAEFSGGITRFFYGRGGDFLGSESGDFVSPQFFGFDWTNYTKTVFVMNDRSSSVRIDDSVTLSNKYPMFVEHSVSTSTYSDNQFRDVTDSTVTTGGQSFETISTATGVVTTDYSRYSTEVRNTNGNLISWTLNSWTNDPAHSQAFTLFTYGGNDESNPFYTERDTNTFDSLGNIVLSTSDAECDGYSFSNVTSNRYVIDQKKRVLSSISQIDSEADGIIDTVIQTTFGYDKFGNVALTDAKQFAGDGTFQGETFSSFVCDRFGNPLYTETVTLDANGAVTWRTKAGNIFVPRGQAFNSQSATQRFLDHIRAKQNQLPINLVPRSALP